jgi:hypothetical protein
MRSIVIHVVWALLGAAFFAPIGIGLVFERTGQDATALGPR